MLGLLPSVSIGENGRATPFGITATGDANYFPQDLMVRVTALPPHGAVLKEDGITPIVLGQIVTAAELATLKFLPALAEGGTESGSIQPENWFVLSASQNGGPRLIGIQTPNNELKHVTLTELPVNGSVLLNDGITKVV